MITNLIKKETKKKSFRFLMICCVLFCWTHILQAQVTIGSDLPPHTDALLDLKESGETTKGLLLPRVGLNSTSSFFPMSEHVKGMVVYNTATAGDVTPGYYYNNGSKWMKLFSAEDSFFYMPSIVLPTDENDIAFASGKFTISLYDLYINQFGLLGSNAVKSESSAKLPMYNKHELYYFVTYYDDAVFTDVTLDFTGTLTYKLKPGFTYTEKTFMNIVLKVK